MDEESLEQLISEIKRLSRLDALSLLCSYLSCSFNYPSIEQAKRYTSAQYIDLGATICAHAFIVARVLDRCQYAAKSAAQSAESAQASPEKTEHAHAIALRQEQTRLFYKTRAVLPLESGKWVPLKERNEQARTHGMSGALSLLYQQHQLKLPQNSNLRSDTLCVQLDFLDYLLEQEETAQTNGDSRLAKRYREIRQQFIKEYLFPFTDKLCPAILQHTENAFIRYWTIMLELLVDACFA